VSTPVAGEGGARHMEAHMLHWSTEHTELLEGGWLPCSPAAWCWAGYQGLVHGEHATEWRMDWLWYRVTQQHTHTQDGTARCPGCWLGRCVLYVTHAIIPM
jgi:hypothetical protein